MNNQEIQNELLQVQKEISELPIGYISKKTITAPYRFSFREYIFAVRRRMFF